MNALEAKQLTRENSTTRAENDLDEAISRLEENIKTAAKEGYSVAQIGLQINNSWIKNHNNEKIHDHFSDKGFTVSSTGASFGSFNYIIVKWY